MNDKPYDLKGDLPRGPSPWKIPDSYGAGFNYQSPIELIQGNLQTQIENNCVKAVQSYGFNVDKEELRKALEYDRNQYDKGYAAARKKYERPTGHWCKTGQSFVNPSKFRNYCCSNCQWELDEHIRTEPNFCQNCGADMRKDNRLTKEQLENVWDSGYVKSEVEDWYEEGD